MIFSPNFFNNFETLQALVHHTKHLETPHKKTLYLGTLTTVKGFTSLKVTEALNQCFDSSCKPLSYPTLSPQLGLVAVITDQEKKTHVLGVYTLKAMENIYNNVQREKAKIKWYVLEILPETRTYLEPLLAKEESPLQFLSLKRGFFLNS